MGKGFQTVFWEKLLFLKKATFFLKKVTFPKKSYLFPEIYIRDGLIASRTGRNKGDFTQKLFRL